MRQRSGAASMEPACGQPSIKINVASAAEELDRRIRSVKSSLLFKRGSFVMLIITRKPRSEVDHSGRSTPRK
jgi:hypothetical protein